MSDYLLLTADRNVLAGRTVTSMAGTPDSDHPVAWLTDLRPAFPIRYPAGPWAVSVSVAAQDIQLVVLANHSLDANVTVGGVTGTIAAPAALPNGARINPYLLKATPSLGVTALTFSGSNAGVLRIGEAFAGVPVSLPPFQMADMTDEFLDTIGDEGGIGGEFHNIPMHDDGIEWRAYGGTQVYTTAQKNTILAARRAQRGMSLPSVLIQDQAVDDARVVLIGRPTFKQFNHRDLWEARLTFVEFPRYAW